MTTAAATSPGSAGPSVVRLPRAVSVLVVTARPGVPGGWPVDLGADAATARAIQRSAAAAHTSQSEALPGLMRRLDLLDGQEAVRWLLFPRPVPAQPARKPWPLPDAAAAAL